MTYRSPHSVSPMGVALLVLFALYWCGITLFAHTHVVNGVRVVHSHPYQVEHTHSKAQLETIFYLSLLQTSGDLPMDILLPCWLIPLGTLAFAVWDSLPVMSVRGVSVRAPPCFRCL